MRQCVVIIGSAADLDSRAPEIRQGEEGIAPQTRWFACGDQKSPANLLDDTDSFVVRGLRWPSLFYQCYLYISSVKTWSGKRPLVFVRGKGTSARLAARAALWGGGDVVQAHDDPQGRLPRARYLLRRDGTLELTG